MSFGRKDIAKGVQALLMSFALIMAAPCFVQQAHAQEKTVAQETVTQEAEAQKAEAPGAKPAVLKTESELEKRVRAIGSKLRCPVCQGESIYDSHSDVAEEMKRLIAEKLKAGESEAKILDYFHDRYGNYILMEPPAEGIHWVIWVFPLFMGLMGLVFVMQFLLSNRQEAATEAKQQKKRAENPQTLHQDIEELHL
jgi:cytochrome c-type biogenesis protein CcmH